MTKLDNAALSQAVRSMNEAVNRKFGAFLGLFGLSFFIMRMSGRVIGQEVIIALLLLLPYAILAIFLQGFLTRSTKKLCAEKPAEKIFVSTASVERAAFCTKWALAAWPLFASLAFATLLLSIAEPLSDRAFIPLRLEQRDRGSCQFVGNDDDRAIFHCTPLSNEMLRSSNSFMEFVNRK